MEWRGVSAVWTDDTWRYPVALGLLATLVLVVLEQFTTELHLVPVLLAVGGSLGVWSRPTKASGLRVGWRAGLTASLALLNRVVAFGVAHLPAVRPSWFRGVVVAVLLVYAAVVVGLLGAIGAIGGALGEWARRRFVDGPRHPNASS